MGITVDRIKIEIRDFETNMELLGWSPLYAASCKGHFDVVKTLLEVGANINQATKVQ